jgi:hypothetical protein
MCRRHGEHDLRVSVRIVEDDHNYHRAKLRSRGAVQEQIVRSSDL